MRIRYQILHFLHEKVFMYKKGDEPNKFTYLIYKTFFPFKKVSDESIINFVKENLLLEMKGTENKEQFVSTNFDHLNFLQPRPYGKQYNAFLRCVKQIEAGQNTVFLGQKWMVISTDYYQKLTDRSKIEIKSIDQLPPMDPLPVPKEWLHTDWSADKPPEPLTLKKLKEIWKKCESLSIFHNQKREETMKSNIGIAQVCHEANRQYCIDNKLPTQALWNELPVTQQNSMISGVQQVIADPKITAAESHENWLEYKTSEGWKYADELNAAKKLHPNMVPFNKLPKVERAKDMLFIKTVKTELKK